MNRNTIFLAAILACISFSKAESSNNDKYKKTNAALANSIQTEKPETFNQQTDQHYRYQQPPSIRYQLNSAQQSQHMQDVLRKPSYPSAQQPVAMVIIAQPAYIPAHLIQGTNGPSGYFTGNAPQASHVAQQLLSFFQANPQSRYHLLYGNQPQPQPTYIQPMFQPRYQQPNNPAVAAAFHANIPMYQPEMSAYPQPTQQTQQFVQQVVHPQPAPQTLINQASTQLQRVPVAAQHSYAQPTADQPQQLGSIADIAQQAAQRFLASGAGSAQGHGLPGGIKSTPAVITGLENFSPEHQAKIKAQLSAHFGAPLQPLSFENAAKTTAASSRSYYSNQYSQGKQSEFVPSQQINGERSSESAEA